WMPAHYVWTPSGCVFSDGYWDYSLRRRGLLFAPVVVQRAILARPGFAYVPGVVVDTATLVDHLFVRPRYHHYYFGDYYAANYLRAGIYPWFAFHASRHGYDPVFAYYQPYHARRDPHWVERLRDEDRLRRQPEAVPAPPPAGGPR